jgi:hypothetical protein
MDEIKKIPAAHYAQVQTGMLVTEYDQWDYMSYDNRLPGNLQTYIITIPKDRKYIDSILEEIVIFWNELNAMLDKLRSYEMQTAGKSDE